jgi:hypothetical protein
LWLAIFFLFSGKKLGRGVAHVSRSSPYLELSISRQPLFSIQESAVGGLSYKVKKNKIVSKTSKQYRFTH